MSARGKARAARSSAPTRPSTRKIEPRISAAAAISSEPRPFAFALVLFVIVGYRRRSDDHPRGTDKRSVTESVFAVLLTVVAVVLVTFTFRTEDKIDPVASKGGVRVDIVAFQWQWRFSYPDFGKVVLGTTGQVPTLVLPVRTLVRFDGVSRDVIHSFWVPEARFKRDEFPKLHTQFGLS